MKPKPRRLILIAAGLVFFAGAQCRAMPGPFRNPEHLSLYPVKPARAFSENKFHLKPIMYSDIVFRPAAGSLAPAFLRGLNISLEESRVLFNDRLFQFDIERDEYIYLLDAENKPLDEQYEILRMKLRLQNQELINKEE
jgi:hypothetical protein